jgi:hypothetical protein
MDILNKRYKYLEELFSTQEPQEQERIMAHIERCMQEIHPIKRDIHSLCHQFQLPNQLLPVETEEESSLVSDSSLELYSKTRKGTCRI